MSITPSTEPINSGNASTENASSIVANVESSEEAKTTNEPVVLKLETKHLEEHYDAKGYAFIVEAGSAPPKKETVDKWPGYVLTYTRHFDEVDRYSHSDIEIKSKPLKKLLKRVIRDYPGESFATDKVQLALPSKVLLHYRDELKALLKGEWKASDEEGRKHLQFLVDWYEEEESELIQEYENLVAQGLITYRLLWTIMKPGCTIYAPLHGQPRAFTLKKSHQTRCFYALDVSYTDYDGLKFGTASTQFHIGPFIGSVAINSLSAYPFSWHSRKGAVHEALIKRGRLWESYKGKTYLEYSGVALGPIVMEKRVKFSINGRVMVDAETFGRMATDRAISVEAFKKKRAAEADEDEGKSDSGDGEDEDEDEEDSGYDSDFADAARFTEKSRTPAPLSDDQCLHATNLVCGFAFNEKEWVEFYIEKLSPVQWNEDAFDHLVLPPKQKNMIKALVQSHMKNSGEDGFDDVIKGKGKGLISVLHGPPGVGKTLTAESIAEFTKRPLYAVSSGELGTSPRSLERNLTEILDMATVWKAVLLLDEADVFLEKRSLHDINRNALVSIFLRLLEYYQGILLLTTNRVESFDEAFQSRIHVALKYNNLTIDSRRTVWKNFLSRIGEEKVDIDEAAYDVLQEYVLNGRQIKNAVKTAKSLAEFSAEKICLETMETVLDIQRDFERDFQEAKSK